MSPAMRGVVLLCLLSLWAEYGMTFTNERLDSVVNYMTEGQPKNIQYAMVAGQTKDMCQNGQLTFQRPTLSKDKVFTSNELIAALPKGKGKNSIHSEYPDQNWKAFVFTQIYAKGALPLPSKEEVYNGLKTINTYVPVYRCDQNGCIKCVENAYSPNEPCLTGYNP
ncbi:hypothetical protein UPYG_G00226010 [Umbra pygmaea]|uniref:Uncharacterized protein n=1 Tax=Umbra pygmaea TaxID=75934 RepID=A0ABD0WDF3_UMBPY